MGNLHYTFLILSFQKTSTRPLLFNSFPIVTVDKNTTNSYVLWDERKKLSRKLSNFPIQSDVFVLHPKVSNLKRPNYKNIALNFEFSSYKYHVFNIRKRQKIKKASLTWYWPSGTSSSPKNGILSYPARCLLHYTTVCPVSPDPTSTPQSLAEGAWKTAVQKKTKQEWK